MRAAPSQGVTAVDVRLQRGKKRADGLSQFGRAAHTFATPERQARRTSGRGRHHHLIVGDLVDPP
ncbi:hypothetical protein B0X78_11615 [bacterium AM6]|nr:hypothetical protein B0X78_11615 [bacterium AM6]